MTPKSRRSTAIVLGLCVLLAAGILASDLYAPRGVAAGVPYVAVVLVALHSPQQRLVLGVAAGATALTVLGYFLSPPGGEPWLAAVNRCLALFAIWTAAILGFTRRRLEERRERAVREREEALEQAKILRGLLPICAWCKKIRDARGAWSRIEDFIQAHSEAAFTHGLCPECRAKYRSQAGMAGTPGAS